LAQILWSEAAPLSSTAVDKRQFDAVSSQHAASRTVPSASVLRGVEEQVQQDRSSRGEHRRGQQPDRPSSPPASDGERTSRTIGSSSTTSTRGDASVITAPS